jgi:hypothetical protein
MDISLSRFWFPMKIGKRHTVAASVLMPKETTSWIEHLAKSYTPFGGISIPGVRLHLPQEEKQNLKRCFFLLHLLVFLSSASSTSCFLPAVWCCDTAAILLSHLPERVVQTWKKKVYIDTNERQENTGEDEKATDFSHGSDDSIDFFLSSNSNIARFSHDWSESIPFSQSAKS